MLALFAVGLATAGSAAETERRCFAGDAGTGTLTFTGAIEGESFTGSFGEFSVRYCLDQEERAVSHQIDVLVTLSSADSDNRDRDSTLRGPEFFAVARFPEARWRSSAVRRVEEGYEADGELTLKGITAAQPVRYILETDGEGMVAQGQIVLTGGGEVDRRRYDVGTGEFADPGFIRDAVEVAFRIALSPTGAN